MAKGKVKWFNAKKGYGFISTEDGKEIFVHHKEIKGDGFRTLMQDEDVEFDVAEGPKSELAKNVAKL